MRVIYSPNNESVTDNRHTGVGLGTFDGLHIGHMALINTLVSESKLLGLKSVVYTFLKHPSNVIKEKPFTSLITSPDKKIELLSETNVDYLYFEEFNANFRKLSSEGFVKNILVDKLLIKLAVVGFNYRFGHKGQGDVNELKRFGQKYGFEVIVIPEIRIDNESISSTIIREHIKKGNLDKVFKLLGRHYSINGRVTSGKKIGNTLGYPTANIEPADYLALPPFGVYITCTLIQGKKHYSVTNIGLNPTIGSLKRPIIETHILNLNQNLYNEKIEVYFISKLREERIFNNKNELAVQICSDVKSAKDYFSLYEGNGRGRQSDDSSKE